MDLIEFYDHLLENAAEDEVYRHLTAEHEAMSTRLTGAMETMTEQQREAVLDYLRLVAEIHNRLLILSQTGGEFFD